MPNINTDILAGLPIVLPPLPEQHRIADLLDRAHDLLRNRREAQRLTDALLRSIFLDMFGDPDSNPRAWPIVAMAKVICDSQYGTPAKANTDHGGMPVLRMGNITAQGSWELSDLKWVVIDEADIEKFTVRPGDLLFNRTNSPELVGKTAVWQGPELYAFAGYLVRLRFDPEQALPEYVSALLNSAFGRRYLLDRARPSNNMSNIRASLLAQMPIPVPPIALQRRFTAIAARVRRAKQLQHESQESGRLFHDGLAQRLFAGEEDRRPP